MSRLSSFVKFYNANFERRPIPTLMITNATLNTIADILAQTSSIYLSPVGSQPSYDPERTLRFAVFGAGMGPLIGRWLRLLERQIPMLKGAAAGGGGNRIQLVKRVLADQIVMAPLGLALFVGSMGLMEGKSGHELSSKYSQIFWPAMLANWKVWPIIQAVNFSVIPFQYRLPFQSTCSIGWNLFLSLLNAEQGKPQPEEVPGM